MTTFFAAPHLNFRKTNPETLPGGRVKYSRRDRLAAGRLTTEETFERLSFRSRFFFDT